MKTQDFKYLLGKSKSQIVEEMGQEYNYYPSHKWSYFLKKKWWGRSLYLIIHFNKNEEVSEVNIKNKSRYDF